MLLWGLGYFDGKYQIYWRCGQMATIIRKSIKVQISAQSDNVNTGFLRKYSFFFFSFLYLFWTDPASGLFAQIAQEVTSFMQTEPRDQPVLLSSRQRPLLWCLHGGLGTSGSLSLTWSLSHSRICSVGLGLSLGLGLWPVELEILGDAGTSLG